MSDCRRQLLAGRQDCRLICRESRGLLAARVLAACIGLLLA
jgi:hypothetical protein